MIFIIIIIHFILVRIFINIESMEKVILQVEGMSCTSCSLGIVKTLENMGLSDVKGNYATGEIMFKPKEEKDIDLAVNTINVMGYKTMAPKEAEEHTHGPEYHSHDADIERLFWISLPFTLLLMLHMVFPHSFLGNPIFQLALSVPVYIIGIGVFGRSAIASINHGVPNMDVLIFSGSSAAFLYSLGGLILFYGKPEIHQFLFFETSASIITLVLLGNFIEHRSTQKTSKAIKELKALQPQKAMVLEELDGVEKWVEIKASSLKKGRQVKINEGAQIPCDGVILSGHGSVEEAMLTGESLPRSVKPGDTIFAGSLLLQGNLIAKTEKSYQDFSLTRIIDLVKNAQMNPPKIQRLGDKVSAWFVPVVLLISVFAFLAAFFVFHLDFRVAVINAIGILVISCPCAMGLATPTAVMVGIGRAAKGGILFRSGEVLEQFAHADIFIFDKTGTLTTGELSVEKVETYAGLSAENAWSIASGLAQHSNHPLSVSIRNNSKISSESFAEVQEIKGKGITGKGQDGSTFKLGSADFIGSENDDSIFPIVYLSKNGILQAKFHLKDQIRQGMKEFVLFLKSQNIETMLLSGDKASVALSIGKELGFQNIQFSKSPEEKQAIVAKLSKENKVVMVGDGINDSAALATAQVGISHGDASSIAINTAGIVITGDGFPEKMKTAYLLSKATLTTIKQNLFWAFCYNIVAIPVAGLGYLTPMFGAASMAFSDIMVIGNSLRLGNKKL